MTFDTAPWLLKARGCISPNLAQSLIQIFSRAAEVWPESTTSAGHTPFGALSPLCCAPPLSRLLCQALRLRRVAAPNKITGPEQTAFRGFVETLWPLAEARGVSRPTFDSAFAGVSFDPSVVASAQSQPEFARPIWDYVASAVSADRIERGRERERSERLWLARANDLYGVDNGVILGVWELETDFGGFAGSNNIIRSLASLAYVRFQGDYLRDELLSALAILRGGRHRSVAHARLVGGRDGTDAVHAVEEPTTPWRFNGMTAATSGPAKPTRSARPRITWRSTAGLRVCRGVSKFGCRSSSR